MIMLFLVLLWILGYLFIGVIVGALCSRLPDLKFDEIDAVAYTVAWPFVILILLFYVVLYPIIKILDSKLFNKLIRVIFKIKD